MAIITTVQKILTKGKLRAIKVLGFGEHDVREPYVALPFGVDCNPHPGLRGVYMKTSNDSEPVLIGYLNKQFITAVGECRLFSTDDKGELKTAIHLKNDGIIEIGGNTDNMVRYSKLEESFNKLKDDHNKLVSTFNTHIHTTTATVGATAVVGIIQATLTTETSSTADITTAKINELKIK